VDTPRPSPRTNRTRRVPHPVLTGHAATGSRLRGRGACGSPLPRRCCCIARRSTAGPCDLRGAACAHVNLHVSSRVYTKCDAESRDSLRRCAAQPTRESVIREDHPLRPLAGHHARGGGRGGRGAPRLFPPRWARPTRTRACRSARGSRARLGSRALRCGVLKSPRPRLRLRAALLRGRRRQRGGLLRSGPFRVRGRLLRRRRGRSEHPDGRGRPRPRLCRAARESWRGSQRAAQATVWTTNQTELNQHCPAAAAQGRRSGLVPAAPVRMGDRWESQSGGAPSSSSSSSAAPSANCAASLFAARPRSSGPCSPSSLHAEKRLSEQRRGAANKDAAQRARAQRSGQGGGSAQRGSPPGAEGGEQQGEKYGRGTRMGKGREEDGGGGGSLSCSSRSSRSQACPISTGKGRGVSD